MRKHILFVGLGLMLFGYFTAEAEDRSINDSKELLLDDLTARTIKDAWGGEGVLINSAEYQAVLNRGLSIIDNLAKRMATIKNPFELFTYEHVFRRITHFDFVFYSGEPNTMDDIDYYVRDIKTLPFLSKRIDKREGDIRSECNSLLLWWDKMRNCKSFAERTSTMRSITSGIAPDGTQITGASYRAYCLGLYNYGIYNIPIYIELIIKDNNPLALMEFLRVSNHPTYQGLSLDSNRLANIRCVAREWPSHKERIDLVKKWWEEKSSEYDSIPSLKQAIAEAIGK